MRKATLWLAWSLDWLAYDVIVPLAAWLTDRSEGVLVRIYGSDAVEQLCRRCAYCLEMAIVLEDGVPLCPDCYRITHEENAA